MLRTPVARAGQSTPRVSASAHHCEALCQAGWGLCPCRGSWELLAFPSCSHRLPWPSLPIQVSILPPSLCPGSARSCGSKPQQLGELSAESAAGPKSMQGAPHVPLTDPTGSRVLADTSGHAPSWGCSDVCNCTPALTGECRAATGPAWHAQCQPPE